MRNRLLFGGVAIAAAAVTALTAVPASASSAVLTYGSAGGTAVAVGDTISGSLQSGTNANLYSTSAGGTGLQCASSTISGAVTSNGTAPGSAAGQLSAFSVGSCKVVNVPGVTGVQSLTLNNLSYTDTISDSTMTNTITPGPSGGAIGATVVLRTLLGNVTCTYAANGNSLSGSASNSNNSLTFTNQQFNKLTGPSACFNTVYFSAAYGPVMDATVGQTLFVN
jgi:hypothetical protein